MQNDDASRGSAVTIELVYDDDCPHVDSARRNLAAALALASSGSAWTEWRRDDPSAPEYARRAGSPAILIDGRDVEGISTDGQACCRVYRGSDGRRATAPAVDVIARALRGPAR